MGLFVWFEGRLKNKKVVPVGFEPTRCEADGPWPSPLTTQARYLTIYIILTYRVHYFFRKQIKSFSISSKDKPQ